MQSYRQAPDLLSVKRSCPEVHSLKMGRSSPYFELPSTGSPIDHRAWLGNGSPRVRCIATASVGDVIHHAAGDGVRAGARRPRLGGGAARREGRRSINHRRFATLPLLHQVGARSSRGAPPAYRRRPDLGRNPGDGRTSGFGGYSKSVGLTKFRPSRARTVSSFFALRQQKDRCRISYDYTVNKFPNNINYKTSH